MLDGILFIIILVDDILFSTMRCYKPEPIDFIRALGFSHPKPNPIKPVQHIILQRAVYFHQLDA